MIILGIDPGVAIVGFGVIEYSGSKFRTLDYGVITTPAHTDTEKRLATIYRAEGYNRKVQARSDGGRGAFLEHQPKDGYRSCRGKRSYSSLRGAPRSGDI